jgi:pimeloyl-ACP methyl ester carboxylesterase
MTKGQKMVLRILILLGGAIALVVASAGWMMWKRPLKLDAFLSRAALRKGGLAEHRLDGPAGRLTYYEGGSGPAMVLLHGAGDQAGAWARVVPGLVTDYRLVVPDLPGHWGSEPVEGPLEVGTVLAGVEALLEARCADEPVIIVGNSLGAWIGFLVAVEHPESVARLVAVNGGPIRQDDPAVNLFPKNRDEARQTMAGLMGPNSPPIPGFVLDDVVRQARTGPPARLAATVADMPRWLLDDRLGEVTVPVDLVWGEADQLFPMDYARRLRDSLPAARLARVEDCGHVPERECPLQFLEVLHGVLDQPPPETASATVNDGGEP